MPKRTRRKPKTREPAPPRCLGCGARRTKKPRRWIVVNHRQVPVCRACHDCYRLKGTFERTPPRWHKEAPKIAAMRKKGASIAEIAEAFPGLPRRTAYAICHRYGLHGVWGYEVGRGGRRGAG